MAPVWLVAVELLVVGSFISRMTDYMNASESNVIFTDDLKSALCLAETDDDVDVTLQMARRFDIYTTRSEFLVQSCSFEAVWSFKFICLSSCP